MELAKRNFKELWRDPLSLAIGLALPVCLLLALQALGGEQTPYLEPTLLAPGIALVGFVMLMFSSAMLLARDRETALMERLLTAPLRSRDFLLAYSLPYVPMAVAQALIIFVLGSFLGLEITGSAALVFLVLLLMSLCYIALGMISGSLLTVKQVSGVYTAVLILTIFGGAWFDLSEIGGVFETVGNLLPFAHALDAMRAVMTDGDGLSAIASDLYWIVGYTVVGAASAVYLFKQQMID